MLEHVLATRYAPTGVEPHIGHLLDEAPIGLVVMAVTQPGPRRGMSVAKVWHYVAKLAHQNSLSSQATWIKVSRGSKL
ncbi:hypothetical protein JJQ59_34440 (plasmid) [Cupriavidus necator]|nr:hypothetical protein [Cupriavidus necator]QQX89642.1 hypothetical protein JJQ59_34440 [Cupriavidus necator]